MRVSIVAALALAVLLLSPRGADASAMEEIQTANKAGQVVFLVVTDAGQRNLAAARTAAQEAQKRVKGSAVVELNRSERSTATAVKRYGLQAAPLPIVLVIAPNGTAVGASRPGKGAIERLVALVPTPKKAELMQAFEQRKTSILVFSRPTMPEQSPLFENLSAVTRELKDGVRLVLVDLDDKAEAKFIKAWDVPMKSLRPTVAVLNGKGQALGRMVGVQTPQKLLETCKLRAPCCDDPKCKGCSDG